MKSLGFKRSDNNWSPTAGTAVQAVKIQGSQSNTTGSAKFTLNLGVYLPQLVEVMGSHIRTRIGLLNGMRDYWWTARPEDEADATGDDLSAAWRDYSYTWLAADCYMHKCRASCCYCGVPP
jgi:hypothetical protein